MDAITSFIDLAQAGGIAILLVIVWQLWTRLNVLTDRFIEYMDERAERGDVAAQKVVESNGRRNV